MQTAASRAEKARRNAGILWWPQVRLNNLRPPDSLQPASLKKKTRRAALQPAGPDNNRHGAHPEEGADAVQILCADLTSVSPVTHAASGGPDGYPPRHPRTGPPIPHPRKRTVLPRTAWACVPSQAALRQSNRHAARATVLATPNTHGFHAFCRLSGSKARGRQGTAPRQAPAKPT